MAFWQLKQFKIVFPLVLFFLLFLDGTLMSSLNGLLTHFPYYILPNLTFVWLFYAVQFERDRNVVFLWLAALIGVLFDAYYTGFFGAHAFAFWASAYVIRQIHHYYTETLLSAVFQLAIGLAVFYLLIYGAGIVVGQADVGLVSFVLNQVLPTMALNIGIMVLLYYPVWRWFQILT